MTYNIIQSDNFYIDKKSYEPAYVQLKRQIVEKIEHSEFKTNQKLPSIRELEKTTKLSRVTTAKAISELVKEGILVSHGCKGTFVAEREINKKTHMIGIAGGIKEKTFFSDPYYLGLIKGVEIVFRRRGKSFHFKHRMDSLSKAYQNNSVDGIIVLAPGVYVKHELLELSRGKTPTIVIGSSFEEKEISYVDSDNVGDSFLGVEHLIKSGHRSIAFIASHMNSSTSYNRLKGYKDALERHNINFDERLVFIINQNLSKIGEVVGSLFNLNPTAIFGTRTDISKKIVELILKKGIRIPEDMEIFAYDDFEDELSKFNIPYIVMKQPLEEIGKRTAEVLLDIIDGKRKKPVKINLKSKLVIRK